nr:protein nrt1/ ptr family 5.2 [Quercus suber]
MAVEEAIDEYTQDGTVDLKGNPVLRSKRGGWKACWFVVGYEVFERMAYYSISSNLVVYLTSKLHQGTVTSANNVTNWVGTIFITPILGAYIADAHLGRYWTFIIACIIYLSGMILLTLSVSLNSLKPPPCNEVIVGNCKKASTLHLAVIYGALYTLAVGTGGTKPNISTIGADQFDEFNPKEMGHKLSFCNWWMFSIFFGTLFANTVLVYVQDNVGWTLGYGLPTLGLAISIAIFVAGTPFYRHKLPTGSPFTRMSRVIVAAIRKWRVTIPNDIKELYELDLEEYERKGKYRIDSTPTMSLLTKASVKTRSTNPWMLCTVTQVEETKQMLRMIPILVATFVPSTMVAQTNTLFVKQGLCKSGLKILEVSLSFKEWFVLKGTADAFLEVAKIEFFYDQAPESMKSLGTSYSLTTLGIGNFLSSFLLSTVSHITKEHGHQGWILNDLNASHLDYYYAFFACLQKN